MSEKLFVYGTLKESKVQREVIGRAVKGVSDILDGYRESEVQIDGETYPIIEQHSNSSVDGLALSVTKDELKCIDKFETEAYKREKVKLRSGISAWAYQKPL